MITGFIISSLLDIVKTSWTNLPELPQQFKPDSSSVKVTGVEHKVTHSRYAK